MVHHTEELEGRVTFHRRQAASRPHLPRQSLSPGGTIEHFLVIVHKVERIKELISVMASSVLRKSPENELQQRRHTCPITCATGPLRRNFKQPSDAAARSKKLVRNGLSRFKKSR